MTVLNRARMTTATTGTDTVTLGSAVSGYATFAEAGAVNATAYAYCIEDGADFEIGIGTYTSSGTTFSRDTVTLSKIGGTAGTSKINLSGSAQIFITARASDLIISGGALGTPSSGTLTNCSGLPLSGVVDSTSEALGVGTLEVGHASDTTLSRSAAGVLAVEGIALLKANGNQTVTGGFLLTPFDEGTESSGTLTPSPANGNYQYYTNNGAHTLAAPTAGDCAIDILVTNGASAGAITFSGFTVGSATGSALTTTNAHRFLISIRRINSVSTYSIYALQ